MDYKMSKLDLDTSNSKEYKIETIWDIIIYIYKTEDYLTSLYYLVAQKDYFKKVNIWKLLSVV